ncbi:hypothetical protein Dimus_033795, partial [Dionaea muscipula]
RRESPSSIGQQAQSATKRIALAAATTREKGIRRRGRTRHRSRPAPPQPRPTSVEYPRAPRSDATSRSPHTRGEPADPPTAEIVASLHGSAQIHTSPTKLPPENQPLADTPAAALSSPNLPRSVRARPLPSILHLQQADLIFLHVLLWL